ncbi:MAG: phosphatase PAP2 family protein [Candidatus Helarchaeota archaeon]
MEEVPQENKIVLIITTVIFAILLIPAALFDIAIVVSINSVSKGANAYILNGLMYIDTNIIQYIFIIIIGVLLLLAVFIRDKIALLEVWFFILMASFLAFGLEELIINTLKVIFQRPRPFQIPPLNFTINLVAGEAHGYSFPSGHAGSSFAVLTPLILKFRNRIYTILIILFGCLQAFARVYVGVHFATDILAGSLIGIGIGLLANFIVKNYLVDQPENRTALLVLIISISCWLLLELLT